MKQSHTRFYVLALILVGLAACGGGRKPVAGVGVLGNTFQQAFNQGPNDTPIDVSNADLVLLLTQDPFEL